MEIWLRAAWQEAPLGVYSSQVNGDDVIGLEHLKSKLISTFNQRIWNKQHLLQGWSTVVRHGSRLKLQLFSSLWQAFTSWRWSLISSRSRSCTHHYIPQYLWPSQAGGEDHIPTKLCHHIDIKSLWQGLHKLEVEVLRSCSHHATPYWYHHHQNQAQILLFLTRWCQQTDFYRLAQCWSGHISQIHIHISTKG